MSTPIVRYRKRPVEVDTIQWTGANALDVVAFTGPENLMTFDDEVCADDPEATAAVFDKLHSTWVLVFTGQHIVRGVRGELYPIAEDVLAETYERVGEEATAAAATATPDFFQPGHAYTHRNGTDFKCVTVTTHPQTGERLAMGWHVDSWDLHYPTTVGINQWRHEYDGVQAPTSAGDGRG